MYFTSYSDLFDFVLIMLSLVDIIEAKSTTDKNGLLVLRSFKVIRVTRLFNKFEKIQEIFFLIADSLREALSLGTLFLFFVFINALLGK